MNFNSDLNIKGHLTISKVTKDGENIIFDDKNMIVSGMGWALSYLFSERGSSNIADYQIDKFQLGVSGNLGAQVSSTYELSGPLSSQEEYITSNDSNLYVFSGYQYKAGSVAVNPSWYGKIPFSKVTKLDDRSVRYSIFLDEDSCNDLTRNGASVNLNEIGLFLKNPTGESPEASVLAAYKYFSNIRKTSDFGLLFRWTISFG
jgi:hypothetical protein